jgi:hypothetical protein
MVGLRILIARGVVGDRRSRSNPMSRDALPPPTPSERCAYGFTLPSLVSAFGVEGEAGSVASVSDGAGSDDGASGEFLRLPSQKAPKSQRLAFIDTR